MIGDKLSDFPESCLLFRTTDTSQGHNNNCSDKPIAKILSLWRSTRRTVKVLVKIAKKKSATLKFFLLPNNIDNENLGNEGTLIMYTP